MRKLFFSTVLALCCTMALAHDPRTTAKNFSHGLEIEGAGTLSLSYKAMHFNETTYKRMQSDEKYRDRLNSGVWSAIGSAECGFDLTFGEVLSKGKYTLGLNIGPNDSFALVLKGTDKTVKVPLKTTSDNVDLPYLTFSFFPTDKPDTFVLEGRCGKYRGVVDFKVPYLAEHAHPAPQK